MRRDQNNLVALVLDKGMAPFIQRGGPIDPTQVSSTVVGRRCMESGPNWASESKLISIEASISFPAILIAGFPMPLHEIFSTRPRNISAIPAGAEFSNTHGDFVT